MSELNDELLSDIKSAADIKEENERSEEQLAINFLRSIEIFATDKYDKPRFTLSKNGIGFAPIGNIMAICAEMKMGKSWLMQQMACAVLRGEYMGLQCDLTDDGGQPVETSVLYFDTEQDRYDSQMVMRRIQYICGWPFDKDNNRFHIYSMRDFEKRYQDKSMSDNRLSAIDDAIRIYKPTVLFIDGVRDLIEDFNDLAESARLVQHLMTLSTRFNCCIWSVLHVNPNSDKMRGHLGTELGNKTTDVFSVHKSKDEVTGEVTFEVKQIAARHRDVDDWLFKIDDSQTISIPKLLDSSESKKNELRTIFDRAFKDKGIAAMNYSEMYDLIHNVEKKRRDTILSWIRDGIKLGMIIEVSGKYTYSQDKAPF